MVTTGILAFIASWNSYLLPLFILNNEASYTLPLGVQSFASQYSVDTARVLAFTSLSMVPGAGLLPDLPEAHRRRAHRRRQGLTRGRPSS